MNKKRAPKGQLARLPNGEKVRIESRDGDSALVRRMDGPRRGTRAVCSIAKLQMI